MKLRFNKVALLLLSLVGVVSCATMDSNIVVSGLKVDNESNNSAVDSQTPNLKWIITTADGGLTQTAYQVLVSSDIESLDAGVGNVWDSGKQKSGVGSTTFAGADLASNQSYYWKVKVWSDDGRYSDWSAAAKWETAILSPSEWQATWINDGKQNPTNDEDFYKEDPAPLFRKEFAVDGKVASAKLFITGLGYYVSYLNGERIGQNYVDPGWTDYGERVYYSTYDVTDMIKSGANCMGVTLGNGWFNPLPLRMWGGRNIRLSLFVGRPAFISELHIAMADGSEKVIVSDESWKVTEGPVRRNNVYLGEEYDARKEVAGWNTVGTDDSKWIAATKSDVKFGKLQSQPLEAIHITKTIKPVEITNPSKGTYLIDMGINFVGLAKFKFDVPAGTKIEVRYGELKTPEGELNPLTSVCGQIKGKRKGMDTNIGGPGSPLFAYQGDSYIAKGGGEEYMPNFTFHGFRYIEIKGLKSAPKMDDIVAYRMHSDVTPVGTFSCSNPMFNKIQEICTNTFVSNIISVQSDCPHRERFGYGGDIVSTSEAFIYNFDMSRFYAKTTNDWLDNRIDGVRFTDTAPFVGVDYCGLGWAMTNPLLQSQLYRYYGNKGLIEENYDAARGWLAQIIKDNPDHIIKKGLSDHEGLTPRPIPEMVTPLYFQTVEIMEYLANVLGKSAEAAEYNALKGEISKAYMEKFFDAQTGKVGIGTQGTQTFALYTGIVPAEHQEAIMKYLVNDIQTTHKGHLSTGIMATKFMLEMLSKYGYHEVAMQLAKNDDAPSWGYMLKNGATTLWEHWSFSDSTFSHNHPMFGSISEWFYKWVGGIQADPAAVGFDKIIINPQIDKSDLEWVKTSYESMHGTIVSNWKRFGLKVIMEVEIPSNTTATIMLPAGKSVSIEGNTAGLKEISDADAATKSYSAKPGKYTFTIAK